MQVTTKSLYDQVKLSGSLGSAAQRREVSADQGQAFVKDEFTAEFDTIKMMDDSFFDSDKTPNKVDVSMGSDMKIKSTYAGGPEGGFLDSEGINGPEKLHYYIAVDPKSQDVRCVGIAGDLEGNLTHAAIFSGNLSSNSFALETLGDMGKLAQDTAFSKMNQYLIAR